MTTGEEGREKERELIVVRVQSRNSEKGVVL